MQARLLERSALRFTPAGIPVVEAQLQHCSEALEAGIARRLDFAFDAIAVGDIAHRLAQEELGSTLVVLGFLATRSRRSTRLQVHVTAFSRPAPSEGAVAEKQTNL